MLTELAGAPASSMDPPKAAWKLRVCLPARLRRPWLPGSMRRNWREFHEQLTHDQAFADAISRRLDVVAAAFLFSSYTTCTILIFAINGSIYGSP